MFNRTALRHLLLVLLVIPVSKFADERTDQAGASFLFDSRALMTAYPSPVLWKEYAGLFEKPQTNRITAGYAGGTSGAQYFDNIYLAGVACFKPLTLGLYLHDIGVSNRNEKSTFPLQTQSTTSHDSRASATLLIIPAGRIRFEGTSLAASYSQYEHTLKTQVIYPTSGSEENADSSFASTLAASLTQTIALRSGIRILPYVNAELSRSDRKTPATECPYAAGLGIRIVYPLSMKSSIILKCAAEQRLDYSYSLLLGKHYGIDTILSNTLFLDGTISRSFTGERLQAHLGIRQSYSLEKPAKSIRNQRIVELKRTEYTLETPAALVLSFTKRVSIQTLISPRLSTRRLLGTELMTDGFQRDEYTTATNLTMGVITPSLVYRPTEKTTISLAMNLTSLASAALEITGRFPK